MKTETSSSSFGFHPEEQVSPDPMSKLLNPLDYPNIFSAPNRLTLSTWYEHIPFAMFLVAAQRPAVFVELGALFGDSYCAFCQAVAELKLPAKCYAVDTWRGDDHSGNYGKDNGEHILAELRAYHDPLYGGFSTLVQSTFDEAQPHFEDGSIDLLHIDGYHTYEAVKHDFETWLPKLSRRAVVLFHDINVRERDFGAFRFWAEITPKYPHFEFAHGYGLGVLGVGPEQPEELQTLFQSDEIAAARLRQFFFRLGHEIELRAMVNSQTRALEQATEQQRQTVSALEQERAAREILAQTSAETIAAKDEQLKHVSDQADYLSERLRQVTEQLNLQWANTQKIQQSFGWRLLQAFWKVTGKLRP